MFWFFVVVATVIAIAVVAFVGNLIRFSRQGFAVAECHHRFANVYDEVLLRTGSPPAALRQAFNAFGSCPLIGKLTSDEVETVVSVIGLANDPKEIIRRLVLGLSTDKTINALRNEDFLKSVIQRFGGFRETLLHATNTTSSECGSPRAQNQPTMLERASTLVGSARFLTDMLTPTIRRDYGEVFAKSTPGHFELFATISFVFCAGLRVDVDVPKSLQGAVHAAIDRSLAEWNCDAPRYYRELTCFVAEKTSRDRDKGLRVEKQYASAAYWIVTRAAGFDDVNDEQVAESGSRFIVSFATTLLQQTDRYWTTP